MELDTADPNCDIYYFGNDMELANIVCCSNRAETKDMKLFRYIQYEPNADLDYSIKAELEKKAAGANAPAKITIISPSAKSTDT